MSRTPPMIFAAVLLAAGCTAVPTAQERLEAACAAGDAASCAAADAAAATAEPVGATRDPTVLRDPRVGIGVSSDGGLGVGLGVGIGSARIGAATGNR